MFIVIEECFQVRHKSLFDQAFGRTYPGLFYFELRCFPIELQQKKFQNKHPKILSEEISDWFSVALPAGSAASQLLPLCLEPFRHIARSPTYKFCLQSLRSERKFFRIFEFCRSFDDRRVPSSWMLDHLLLPALRCETQPVTQTAPASVPDAEVKSTSPQPPFWWSGAACRPERFISLPLVMRLASTMIFLHIVLYFCCTASKVANVKC